MFACFKLRKKHARGNDFDCGEGMTVPADRAASTTLTVGACCICATGYVAESAEQFAHSHTLNSAVQSAVPACPVFTVLVYDCLRVPKPRPRCLRVPKGA